MAFLHPVGVLPFLRVRALDGPALVVGAVAADFEYFLTLSARKHVHPHPLATFGAGVVVGVALLALLAHVGPGVARALPPVLARRFSPALSRAFATSRLAGVVVGALTHVVLDALTHKGPLAALVPGLPVRALSSASLPVGVCALALAVALAPVATGAHDARWPRHLVGVVGAIVVGAAALGALRSLVLTGSAADVMAAASAGAIAGVAVAGFALARGAR